MTETEVETSVVSNVHVVSRSSAIMETFADVNDTHRMLVNLSREYARTLLPTIIYITIMTAVGAVGNSIAFLVYYKGFKPSSSRTFILAVSVISLVACLLCFPAKIAQFFLYYNFNSPSACRLISVFQAALGMSTGLVFAAIAVDRKRKICCPSARQWTARDARCVVGVCMALAVFASSPLAALSGGRTVNTRHANVTGVTCGVERRYDGSIHLVLYQVLLNFTFVPVMIVIATSYIQIALKVWEHKKNTLNLSSFAATVVQPAGKHNPGVEVLPLESITGEEGRSGVTGIINEGGFTNSNFDPTNGKDCPNSSCWTYTSPDNRNVAARSRTKFNDNTIDTRSANIMNERAQTNGIIDMRRDNVTSYAGHAQVVIGTGRLEVNDVMNNTEDNYVVNDRGCNNIITNTTDSEPGASLARAFVSHDSSENLKHLRHGTTATLPRSSVTHPLGCLICCQTLPWISRCRTSRRYTTSPVAFASPAPTTPRDERRAVAKKISARTTFTLMTMTIVFVLSYVPTLTVLSMRTAGSYSDHLTSPGDTNVRQFCLLSHYLGFAVSPFVYCVCSVKFRQQFRKMVCSRSSLSRNVLN